LLGTSTLAYFAITASFSAFSNISEYFTRYFTRPKSQFS
jgi:hypothetical protein